MVNNYAFGSTRARLWETDTTNRHFSRQKRGEYAGVPTIARVRRSEQAKRVSQNLSQLLWCGRSSCTGAREMDTPCELNSPIPGRSSGHSASNRSSSTDQRCALGLRVLQPANLPPASLPLSALISPCPRRQHWRRRVQ